MPLPPKMGYFTLTADARQQVAALSPASTDVTARHGHCTVESPAILDTQATPEPVARSMTLTWHQDKHRAGGRFTPGFPWNSRPKAEEHG